MYHIQDELPQVQHRGLKLGIANTKGDDDLMGLE